ncbi:unnamed protein product [Lampetra fluviatilis]
MMIVVVVVVVVVVSPAGPCVDSLPTRPHVDLSYVHGASASPLTTTSVGGSLERSALTNPHRTAIVSCQQGVRLTFSQLLTRVDRLACGLMSLGLERGDRIGVWGPNSVEWVVTFLAASRAGLILVGCKAIVSAVEFKGRRYHQLLATVCPELLTSSPGEMHAKRFPSDFSARPFTDIANPPIPPLISMSLRSGCRSCAP